MTELYCYMTELYVEFIGSYDITEIQILIVVFNFPANMSNIQYEVSNKTFIFTSVKYLIRKHYFVFISN